LDSYVVTSVSIFGLDMVYHSKYFYVMCCECDDNDGYKRRHKNAQQLS